MLNIISDQRYQEALQDLKKGLQAAPDNPETQKVIQLLAKIRNIYQDDIFEEVQKSQIKDASMLKAMETINHIAGSVFNSSADDADKECGQICSDLQDLSISVLTNRYQNTLEKLKEQLSILANPYAKQNILKGLQACQLAVKSDVKTYSFESVLSLDMPEEIKGNFKKFSSLTSDVPLATVISDMESIIKGHSLKEAVFWESYEVFFKLPQILKLDNGSIENIQGFIQSSLGDAFKRDVLAILETRQIDMKELEQGIKKTRYKNLNTLLAQLIKQKPVKKEGLATYWNESEVFFTEKTIYLTDPETLKTHNGTIVKSQKDRNGAWIFTLHDDSEIKIEPSYHTTITSANRYKLLTAILNGTLNPTDVFTLKLASDQSIESGMVAGTYYFSQIENNKTITRKPYKEIRLNNLENTSNNSTSNNYTIRINLQEKNNELVPKNIEIEGGSNKSSVSLQAFNSMYTAIKQDSQSVKGINKSNADDQILIKDEKDGNKIRMMHLKQIKEALDTARSEFLKSANKHLLDFLIDDLAGQKLEKISAQGMSTFYQQRPDLEIHLKDISKKYETDLKIHQTPERILKQLIEEANYALLVDKNQSVVVSRTMELLKDAYKNLEKIEGKDVIFFVGNTGAGKSTAISYFLGAEMEIFTNRVGDKVVRVKGEEENETSQYPTIGQSLGESETLYAKGYPLEDFPHVLGDCPGFNDTRGGDFEICTNLSIDQAIAKSKSIRSIVLIIPLYAFLVDRANPLIELIETVRERFTDAFDPTKIGENSNFFILITKHNQNEAAVESIKNGTRIQELLNESKKKLEDDNAVLDDFELKRIERRKNIWQTLRLMHDKKQIDFIDIEDAFEKDELLTKYTTASQQQVKKSRYVNAMQGQDMQMKFGKYIEMSAHTWAHSILTPYLIDLPQKIQQLNEDLAKENGKIILLDQQQKSREMKIASMEENEKKLKNLIDELIKLEKDPHTAESNTLLEEIKSKSSAINDENINQLNFELTKLERDIKNENANISELRDKITKINDQSKEAESEIIKKNRDIQDLSKGSTTKLLWNCSYKDQEELSFCHYSDAVREKAFKEGRTVTSEEAGASTKVKTKDYRGTLQHLALISKEYRVIPADPTIRQAFIQSMQRNNSYNSGEGKFAAALEGERFSVDLGVTIHPEGKQMVYGFKTEWKGDILPWVKISHTIPNIDLNEATIINKGAEVTVLEKKQKELQLDLDGAGKLVGKKKELETLLSQITGLERKKDSVMERITEAKNRALENSIEESRKAKEKELADNIRLRNKEKNFDELNKSREIAVQSAQAIEEKIVFEKKQKRNFAIIIKNNGETAKQLREFCILVLGGEVIQEERSSMIATCKKFKKIYDENIHHLAIQVEEDLKLA
ncbi:MAG: hypothetical protein QRY71_06295 [Candidatus Rhabdochlamydia sp.]